MAAAAGSAAGTQVALTLHPLVVHGSGAFTTRRAQLIAAAIALPVAMAFGCRRPAPQPTCTNPGEVLRQD